MLSSFAAIVMALAIHATTQSLAAIKHTSELSRELVQQRLVQLSQANYLEARTNYIAEKQDRTHNELESRIMILESRIKLLSEDKR